MLDRSLKAEFESYRKTLSTDGARPAFDERIERLLKCPPSALMRQIGWVEEGRISGSS